MDIARAMFNDPPSYDVGIIKYSFKCSVDDNNIQLMTARD